MPDPPLIGKEQGAERAEREAGAARRTPEFPTAGDEHGRDEQDHADQRADGECPGAQRPGHAREQVVASNEQDPGDNREEGQQ